MIKGFAGPRTAWIHAGKRVKGLPADILTRAVRKLFLIDTVIRLEDLRVPPGNRLEALTGDRAGQHSIRVNDQWRLCFVWRDGNAHDVELCDYH
jgi:proteic killer suppression protein